MKEAKGYEDLKVWEESDRLALEVYRLTANFPKEHRYELTSQINRAALSVPTNIVEGCGSEHRREFLQFLNIARRSLNEIRYLLGFAQRLGLIEKDFHVGFDQGYEKVGRMLEPLIKSIKKRDLSEARN